jgi:phosphotransferase system  glucose/maltose/N-acetylglucosamine-specific IIC component
LPFSALVVGAMTPDFEDVRWLRPRGTVGHTPLGLVAFCLPVGLVVWAVFRGVVAPALLGLPALTAEVPSTLLPRLRWCSVLQHASTIVGGAVVLVAIARWLSRQPPQARRFAPGQLAHAVVVMLVMLAVAVTGAAVNGPRAAPGGLVRTLGFAAVGGMASFAVALVAYGAIQRVRAALGVTRGAR